MEKLFNVTDSEGQPSSSKSSQAADTFIFMVWSHLQKEIICIYMDHEGMF